jgi:hypothetical protein
MSEHERGSIIWQEAYALGKMLDHSAWQRDEPRLPRQITPSDYDAVIGHTGIDGVAGALDNFGKVLLLEFSRSANDWREIGRGQRLLYQGLLQTGPHCAVLCHHNIAPELGRKICTRWDVISIHLMLFDHGLVFDGPWNNDTWQILVQRWFENALGIRRAILGHSVGMRQLPKNVISLRKPRP